MFKKILWVIAGLVLVGGLGAGGFAYAQIQAFDASMAKTYDVPLPKVTLTQRGAPSPAHPQKSRFRSTSRRTSPA